MSAVGVGRDDAVAGGEGSPPAVTREPGSVEGVDADGKLCGWVSEIEVFDRPAAQIFKEEVAASVGVAGSGRSSPSTTASTPAPRARDDRERPATVAQFERCIIGQRTKDALAVKRRGACDWGPAGLKPEHMSCTGVRPSCRMFPGEGHDALDASGLAVDAFQSARLGGLDS